MVTPNDLSFKHRLITTHGTRQEGVTVYHDIQLYNNEQDYSSQIHDHCVQKWGVNYHQMNIKEF